MKSSKSAVIVGGGIGGLTTALALQQYGIASRVYESRFAETFTKTGSSGSSEMGSEIACETVSQSDSQLDSQLDSQSDTGTNTSGAGIWVPANAMQVFARLGLAEKVLAAGYEIDEIELLDYLSGSLMKFSLEATKKKFAYSIVAIKRRRLHEILLAALREREEKAVVELFHGYRCQGVELDRAEVLGERVAISFFQRENVYADFVVAADGLHSAIRQSIFPLAQPNYSGQTSWRAVVRAELPEPWRKSSVEIWGEGRRFGFSHLSADQVYWYATADMPASSGSFSAAAPAVEIASLRELFASFPAAVHNLVASTSTVIRTDLSDLPILPQWYRGKIVLVGDAAHATTPNLGQGGAQAIEDGYLLAKMIDQYATPEEAFHYYQKIRQEKARRIVTRSRLFGQIAHLKGVLPRQLRNVAVKYTPQAANLREFEKLFSLNF
ncbi:MAG: FAD-dependent monooxygenase [Candidatus Obscuribacterales bacterium]